MGRLKGIVSFKGRREIHRESGFVNLKRLRLCILRIRKGGHHFGYDKGGQEARNTCDRLKDGGGRKESGASGLSFKVGIGFAFSLGSGTIGGPLTLIHRSDKDSEVSAIS